MKVRLSAAAFFQLVDGQRVKRVAGEVFDASPADAARLIGCGAAHEPGAGPARLEPKPLPNRAEEALEHEPAVEEPKRPAQAAKVEAWQDYAKARGVDIKGMSKAEIIATVG